MKLWTRVVVVMLAGLLAATGALARPGAPGKGGGSSGHSGSGGHGGHGRSSSGRSSGSSSGRGVGHAINHSFGRLFGRHSNAPGSSAPNMAPPPPGVAVTHTEVVQLLAAQIVFSPAPRNFHHRRINDFPFGGRFLLFPPRPGFGFGACAGFGFPGNRFFFADDFNCFAGGFFFAPLFINGFSGSSLGSPAFLPFNDQTLDYDPDDPTLAPPAQEPTAQPSDAAESSETRASTQDAAAENWASVDQAKSQQPITLLQLLDGSMYGLVDYWVEDRQLHYTTTYGGQDSLALDRIDLQKTVQLNAERGIPFVLRPKTPRP